MSAVDLKGRTAVITGGARGIGFAAAEKMLASGAAVALWDIDSAALGKAAAKILTCDLSYDYVKINAEYTT